MISLERAERLELYNGQPIEVCVPTGHPYKPNRSYAIAAAEHKRPRELLRAHLIAVRDRPHLSWLVLIIDRQDRPHLLADRNQKADYTHDPNRALPDEPEAVDAQTLKDMAKENHQEDLARHTRRRERWLERQQADRLRDLADRLDSFRVEVPERYLSGLEKAVDRKTTGRRAA